VLFFPLLLLVVVVVAVVAVVVIVAGLPGLVHGGIFRSADVVVGDALTCISHGCKAAAPSDGAVTPSGGIATPSGGIAMPSGGIATLTSAASDPSPARGA
jgi:hypothetical protein